MNYEQKRAGVLGVLNVFAEQTSVKAMLELVRLYLSKTPPKIQDLQNAIDAKDFYVIEQVAHLLKSNSGFLGLTLLQDLLTELEQLAINQEAQRFPELKRDLELQMKDYTNILNEVLESRKEPLTYESDLSY